SKLELFGIECLSRVYIPNRCDDLGCGQTEDPTRPPALACAVTAACSRPVIGAAMAGASILMAGGHGVRRVAPHSAGAMHRTGHDRSCGPTQRRDPRPEKDDE